MKINYVLIGCNKLKKLVLLLVFLFSSILSLEAQTVSEEVALSVAKKFYLANASSAVKKKVAKGKAPVFFNITKQLKQNNDTYFVYNVNENDGYIIVSNEYAVDPILGYADKGHLSTIEKEVSPEFNYLLEEFQKKIEYVKANPSKTSKRASGKWSNLTGKTAVTSVYTTAVSPLIKTNWGQSPYYNAKCPSDANGQAITGCVATAIAQVMKFWNYPAKGVGSHCYTNNSYKGISYGNLCVDFGATTYKWADMPNELNANSTPAQIDAVATLMYHVGVGVDMAYSTSASGAWPTTNNALVAFFNYTPDTDFRYRGDMSNAQWSALIKNDLDKGFPVLYTGNNTDTGHEWVCDGYDMNGLFHMNFGWGGGSNGYFNLDNPLGYVNFQACYFNLRPKVGEPIQVYVKREGVIDTPKVHAWSNDTGVDVPITPWDNSPSMIKDNLGWYKTTIYNKKSVGVLFKYSDKNTADFKWFTKDVWVLLDSNGVQKQVSYEDPRNGLLITAVYPELLAYKEGESAQVTVTAQDLYNTVNPAIYYTKSEGGVPADPTVSSTLFTGPISINKTTTFKFVASKNGKYSDIKSITYTFNPPNSEFSIFVKRKSSDENPKFYAWSNATGVDVGISNATNWPVNLTYMSPQNDWFVFTTAQKSLGILFKYTDKQTKDFKYFSSTKWIVLDEKGDLFSITDENPDASGLGLSKDKEPNANGKYALGTRLGISIYRYVSCPDQCSYLDYYTLDGSDPKTSPTRISYSAYVNFSISQNTRVRAISGLRNLSTGTVLYTNEIDQNFQFEYVAPPIVKITTSPLPNANGKFNAGQTVIVTLAVENPPEGYPRGIRYTTDGSEANFYSTTYNAPLSVTSNTVIKAKVLIVGDYRYPVYSEQATMAIEFETVQPIIIYAKKGAAVFGQEPRIHVWSKETGTDVPITNTTSWPNNLPTMIPAGYGDWYKYTVPSNSKSLGCLFIFGSVKSEDFIAVNSDTWIEFNLDGTIKYRGTVAPVTSFTAAINNGEPVANGSFVLYPNPPMDYLNVSYSFMGVESVQISIVNMNGTLLYSKNVNSINGFKDSLNISDLNLTAGTYFMSVNSSKGKQTKRFVISK